MDVPSAQKSRGAAGASSLAHTCTTASIGSALLSVARLRKDIPAGGVRSLQHAAEVFTSRKTAVPVCLDGPKPFPDTVSRVSLRSSPHGRPSLLKLWRVSANCPRGHFVRTLGQGGVGRGKGFYERGGGEREKRSSLRSLKWTPDFGPGVKVDPEKP
jgi:hypothetical protein